MICINTQIRSHDIADVFFFSDVAFSFLNVKVNIQWLHGAAGVEANIHPRYQLNSVVSTD